MKKAIVTLVFMLVISGIFSAVTFADDYDPQIQNYMGFEGNPKHVTVGDTFYFNVYADVGQEIDTVAMDNNESEIALTFLPAGIVNFSGCEKGNLFNDLYTIMWIKPIGNDINNTAGTVKDFLWAVDGPGGGAVNNTNATAFNLTWDAISLGTVTLDMVGDGGTARGGIDYGTTMRNGTIMVHPAGPTGGTFNATAINSTQIDLEWSKSPSMDKTVIVYKTGSYPTNPSDGTVLYNDTGTSTSHTGLSSGDHIYYSAWGWNETVGYYSIDYETADAQTNYLVAFSDEDPVNESVDVDKNYATVSVNITDLDADTFNWTIEGQYVTNTGQNDETNGTKTANLILPLPYDAVVYWYVNATDGYEWTRAIYHFTVRGQYEPDPPDNATFKADTYNRTRIDLSWFPNDDRVIIEFNSAPDWNIGEGTEIYNNTGSSHQHTGLDGGVTYYYQIWSYNSTDNVYSSTYSEAWNTTDSNNLPIFTNEIPTNNSDYESVYSQYLNITVNDANGDSLNVSFYWGNDTLIAYTVIAANTTASIYLPDYIDPDWLEHGNYRPAGYDWYAKANDSFGIAQSDDYWFNTTIAWDLDEDKDVDYLDISLFVSHYDESVTPGGEPWDVNNDGDTDYLDASLMATHYSENY